jgi:hypothetical protein
VTPSEPTPEERKVHEYVKRFNMAMAEAGYPRTRMHVSFDERHMYSDDGFPGFAPPAVVWQAFKVAKMGDPHPCWSCWEATNRADPLGDNHDGGNWASDCVTGKRGGCHFPNGPATPPRELLVNQ